MRAAGVDPVVISEIMGHTDTGLNEQAYELLRQLRLDPSRDYQPQG